MFDDSMNIDGIPLKNVGILQFLLTHRLSRDIENLGDLGQRLKIK